MKLIIGITSSQNKIQNIINNSYIETFTTEETTPIILPNIFNPENEITTKEEVEEVYKQTTQMAKICDALVLTGGSDLNPITTGDKLTDSERFNQNRDIFERQLVKCFLLEGKPILGICRGFQLLGKQLNLNHFQQDLTFINEEHDGTRSGLTNRKEPLHNVHIFGKLLDWLEKKEYNIANEGKMKTNSWHHQGFTLLPNGERVKTTKLDEFIEGKVPVLNYTNKNDKEITSTTPLNDFGKLEIIMSTNKVIEGFQHKDHPILAFQYHPEEYKKSPVIEYFIEEYVKKIANKKAKTEEENKNITK